MTSAPSPTAADVLNATIIERNDLTPDLAIVKIRPDSGRVPEFEPGQFCTLGLPMEEPPPANAPPRKGPRLLRRSYSIASSADVRDHYELYMVLVPGGKLTPRVWPLREGGRLWMAERSDGLFTLDLAEPGKDLVMIATGTGLAPYVSMLRTYRGRNQRKWSRFVVIHGTRLCCDLAYMAELKRVTHEDPSVVYVPIVTREPADSNWEGMRGRVHTVLEAETYKRIVGAELAPDRSEVFLCGNPAMVTEVTQNLSARGFVADAYGERGSIHFEKYW